MNALTSKITQALTLLGLLMPGGPAVAAEKVSVPSVVLSYVVAEQGSPDLLGFCKETRKFVDNAIESCPDHEWALVVDENKTHIDCTKTASGSQCVVTFHVVAEGEPYQKWAGLRKPKKSIVTEVYAVAAGSALISNPLITPHFGVAAVKAVIVEELDRVKGIKIANSYINSLLNSQSLLDK